MTKRNLILFICVILIAVATLLLSEEAASHHDSKVSTTPASFKVMTEGVVSVDVKFVNDTVHLLLGRIEQEHASLWYQSSTDQGQTWSQAVDINNGLNIKARFHRGNDARLAVQGNNIVAVWMSRKEGAPHNAGPMMSVRSSDLGKTWQLSTSPADWDGPHGFFAMDGDDERISLVWLDSRKKAGTGAQGLRFTSSLDGGMSWLDNKTLDGQSCACCWNNARFNDNGDFYVVYRDKQPSDMAIGKLNQAQQWQHLSSVGAFEWDFQGCPHMGAGFDIDAEQQFHSTVSTGLEDKEGVYYLSSNDQGLSWSEPVQLGDNTAVHSDLAVNTRGDVLAAWDRVTESGFQIVYSRSNNDSELWTEASLISAQGTRSSHPRVIAMNDTFLVLWTESDKTGHRLKMKRLVSE